MAENECETSILLNSFFLLFTPSLVGSFLFLSFSFIPAFSAVCNLPIALLLMLALCTVKLLHAQGGGYRSVGNGCRLKCDADGSRFLTGGVDFIFRRQCDVLAHVESI